jgi:hypothetical protein
MNATLEHRMKRTVLSALLLAAGIMPATAASPGAWAEMREQIESECRALAETELGEVSVRVDPFGSASYGLALVTGRAGETPVERICVMDKAGGTVELGGELPAEEPTEGALSFLAPSDAADLKTMEQTARTTLAELGESGAPLDPAAMKAAEAALDNLDATTSTVAPGAYACTVYWYGFLDQGANRVGNHQCRVSETEAGVTVEKITGERLAATLAPTAGGLAYVGRTFLEDHAETAYDAQNPVNAENENFGNKVGLAAARDGSLYLLSTQARGMYPKDATFFEVIALSPES